MQEEIIIDGVDVAGCEYISDIDCSCIFVKNYYGTTTNPRCSQVKNCHYKQLKRLEQENKALNFKINQLKANGLYNDLTGIELSAKVVELEQENKSLQAYKDINEDFKKAWDELNEKYKQLRSALEEIREITKDIIENDVYENSDVKAQKILDKINEVLKWK